MSMKSDAFWKDFFDSMFEEYGIKIEVTKDSLRDLSDYFKQRKHMAVAEEIEERLESGIYPPPLGDAGHLNAPDQMFGKIKNRRSGLRIIYYPYHTNGIDHFKILIVGPRNNNEIYNMLPARLRKHKNKDG